MDLVGLAELGGVGYVVDDGVREWRADDVVTEGPFDVDGTLACTEDIPVSSLGSGSFNGSRRYLAA